MVRFSRQVTIQRKVAIHGKPNPKWSASSCMAKLVLHWSARSFASIFWKYLFVVFRILLESFTKMLLRSNNNNNKIHLVYH